MFGMKYNLKNIEVIMCISVVCSISCLLAGNKVDCFMENLLEVLWLLVITMIVAIQLGTVSASRQIKYLVIIGYTLRIVMAILQTYYSSLLPGFMTEDDQGKFIRISNAYYNGDFSAYSTNFPILLYKLFYITGTGELQIRILFVYLWFLGFILIQKMAGSLNGKRHWFLILFYSMLPWTLYISTAIFREPIKMYSLMLSLFFLRKWMQDGKEINVILSVVSSIPALWLHNGDVAILIVVFMTTMLWDIKKQKWNLTGLNGKKLIIIAGIVFLPIIYNLYVKVFPGYFKGSFSVDYLMSRIVYTEARTNYVPPTKPRTIPEFLLWTPYRMFYFWASPTPRFWSSSGDVILFFTDSIPWIVFFVYLLKGIKQKHFDEGAKIAILIFLSFTFIYAWGTRNAGTALRHRDHLLGLFVMTGLMERKNNTGEVKKHFKTVEKKE